MGLANPLKYWKILLNSLYGSLLNDSFRMYDQRLGQSTTLTGRSIVRHMNATINETITGEYDYRGDAIVYSDTDSSYFSAYAVLKDNPDYADFEWTKENVSALYDEIAEVTNKTFPGFMHERFNTTLERGEIIRAGKELVASLSLFIKKKKYACLMYEYEGKRVDVDGKPGKIKAMGLDLKRADTPKYMQEFLNKCLMGLLTGSSKDEIFQWIREFRKEFKDKPGWEKGAPKGVKALSDFLTRDNAANAAASLGKIMAGSKKGKNKIDMPGHVRASLAWNKMCETNNDRYSMRISDGQKVIVCRLLQSSLRVDSVAYPIDEPHLPDWFRDLPFDHVAMEDVIIDKKLTNLLGVLDWDFNETKDRPASSLFSFG